MDKVVEAICLPRVDGPDGTHTYRITRGSSHLRAPESPAARHKWV